MHLLQLRLNMVICKSAVRLSLCTCKCLCVNMEMLSCIGEPTVKWGRSWVKSASQDRSEHSHPARYDEASAAPRGQVLTRGYCSEGMCGVMNSCLCMCVCTSARCWAMGSIICRIRASRLRPRLYLTPGSAPPFPYRLFINGIFNLLSPNHNENDNKSIWSALIDSSFSSDNGRISKRLPFILHPTVCRYLDTCRRREMQRLTTSQVDQTQPWWTTGEAHQSVKSTQVSLTFLHFSCKF